MALVSDGGPHYTGIFQGFWIGPVYIIIGSVGISVARDTKTTSRLDFSLLCYALQNKVIGLKKNRLAMRVLLIVFPVVGSILTIAPIVADFIQLFRYVKAQSSIVNS